MQSHSDVLRLGLQHMKFWGTHSIAQGKMDHEREKVGRPVRRYCGTCEKAVAIEEQPG